MQEKNTAEKKSFAAVFQSDYMKNWPKRFLLMLAVCFTAIFTVVFIGPLDIINSNQTYLTFTAGDLLWTCAWVTVLGSVVLAALLAFIPKGHIQGAVFGVLLGITVMLYIQALFMNNSIVVMDGSGYDWHDYASEARMNIIIWIAVIVVLGAVSCLFSDIAKTGGLIICAAIVLAQGVGLVTSWVPEDKDAVNYQLDGSDMFTLSSDENFIIISLDQFNPLLMDEALEEDPTLYDTFKDFIYYDNCSSVYSFTFPSLMYLMTHNYLDTTIPTREAVANAWSSDICQEFYDTLHDDGYNVELYMEANYAAISAENMIGKADNVKEAGDLIITGEFFSYVVEMSAYRYFPMMMKNNVYVSTGGIVDLSSYEGVGKLTINYDFYSTLLDEGLSLTDEKQYKWYHLQGPHFPYIVSYDGFEVPEDTTTREEQLHGYLVAVGEFLNQMKELGIYDDANIIITADHGYFECFQAVCMVKPAGQQLDEMEISSAPVSQEDISATILYLLGEDNYTDYGYSVVINNRGETNDYEGTTVFDWDEGDVRYRTTHVWGYMTSYPEAEWIGNLDQWDAEANGGTHYNVFGVFTYNGDRDTILDMERYWYYYGDATYIQPLYDSFY